MILLFTMSCYSCCNILLRFGFVQSGNPVDMWRVTSSVSALSADINTAVVALSDGVNHCYDLQVRANVC